MEPQSTPFDWYYIGRFGQLGPLSLDQMLELVRDGVIAQDTYVWKVGMPNWMHAGTVAELHVSTGTTIPSSPPPTPQPVPPRVPEIPKFPSSSSSQAPAYAPFGSMAPYDARMYSSRNRYLAGALNILFPGLGRLYTGHYGTGLMMMATTLCFGIGYIWSFVDGILFLVGAEKRDADGRILTS